MSAIMTRCPRSGKAVPTGIDTDWVVFDTMPDVKLSMRCCACGGQHVWSKRDAWIGNVPDNSKGVAA